MAKRIITTKRIPQDTTSSDYSEFIASSDDLFLDTETNQIKSGDTSINEPVGNKMSPVIESDVPITFGWNGNPAYGPLLEVDKYTAFNLRNTSPNPSRYEVGFILEDAMYIGQQVIVTNPIQTGANNSARVGYTSRFGLETVVIDFASPVLFVCVQNGVWGKIDINVS